MDFNTAAPEAAPAGTDIRELAQKAEAFAERLAKVKASTRLDAGWYPYNSITNVWTLERLLSGERRDLLGLAEGRPILDVGCADGDLAFFLESLGLHVHAIDNPIANFNAMAGVRALKQALHSRVEIHSADLDARFELPRHEFGLAVVLGLIYHLKNPWYVLDSLSRVAKYCLVSTPVTDYLPGLYDRVTEVPVAFLADVYELNQDSTNYWILSDAGFRRMMKRCNWEICDYLLTGDASGPDATGKISGRRAFCLARSTFAAGQVRILYGKGWHPIEEGGWRWTERLFAIRAEGPAALASGEVRLGVFIPDELIARVGPVTLRAVANGVDLGSERFDESGEREFRRSLAGKLPAAGDVRVDFFLDKALPRDGVDGRELGIVVSSVRVDLPGK